MSPEGVSGEKLRLAGSWQWRELALVTVIPLVSRLIFFAVAYGYPHWILHIPFDRIRLCLWDCQWFSSIAVGGYELFPPDSADGQTNWPFFPLLPLVAGALSRATRLSVTAALLILSNLAFLSSVPILYAYCRKLGTIRLATDVALVVSFSPFSLYYSVGYSEAPFLLLTTLAFLFWQRDKYVLAGLVAALATATRLAGVFLIPAFALWSMTGDLRQTLIKLLDRDALRRMTGLATIPLGLALYMIHLHAVTGDSLGFLHAEVSWTSSSNTLGHIIEEAQLRDPMTLISLTAIVLGAVFVVRLAARRRTAEAVFLLSGGLLIIATKLAMGGGLFSAPRFLFGLFPAYVAFADLLIRMRVPRWVYLPVLLLGQANFAVAWVTGERYVL